MTARPKNTPADDEFTQGSLRWLMVTDLDGSLLDSSYAWSDASKSIDALKRLNVPLILNSSKTLEELIVLARQLHIEAPLIGENGAVIGLPVTSPLVEFAPSGCLQAGYHIWVPGLNRDHILAIAHQLRKEFGFKFSGFHDWSISRVQELTGLGEAGARAAVHRRGTEPILWEDSRDRLEQFVLALGERGVRLLQGGRFMHLMGSSDKSDGLHTMKYLYRKAYPGGPWKTVALGDSANDLAMLSAADIAVTLPDRNGERLAPSALRVIHAVAPGPVGWNLAVLEIIREWEAQDRHG